MSRKPPSDGIGAFPVCPCDAGQRVSIPCGRFGPWCRATWAGLSGGGGGGGGGGVAAVLGSI